MYSSENGHLESILNNVFKTEEGAKSDITAFKIDARHRKAYIANNLGFIYVINAHNGVIIKNVTQYIEDQKDIELYKKDPKSVTMTSLGSSHCSSNNSIDEMNIYNETPPKKKETDTKVTSESAEKLKEIKNEATYLKQKNDEFE